MKDLSILDSLITGRVEPHIYAFTTNTIPNYLKVGDTYRPVSKRLGEWKDAIYLCDDRFQLILNGSGKPIEISDIPIEDIDDFFEDKIKAHNECSHLVADAPPLTQKALIIQGFLFLLTRFYTFLLLIYSNFI